MADPIAEPSNPFWDFSLALYGRPGVAPALLGLQDRRGADVNLLLYCCWMGSGGQLLTQVDLARARDAGLVWQQEIVHPIRAARRRLKQGFPGLNAEAVEALRRRLGDIEIEAERVVQDAMAGLRPIAAPASSSGGAAGAAVTAANLKTYLRMKEVRIAATEENDLLAILRGCFPGAALEEVSFVDG
jgi:uncharacterized protein (TIGR02444 family)